MTQITDTENACPRSCKVTAYCFLYVGFVLIAAYFTNIYNYHDGMLHYMWLSALFYGFYILVNHTCVKHYVSFKTIVKFEIMLTVALCNMFMGLILMH